MSSPNAAAAPRSAAQIRADYKNAKAKQEAGPQGFADTASNFGARLLASFKADSTGVENYLKAKYGDDNVKKDTDGNLLYAPKREGKQKDFIRFDPEGLDVGDIADVAPQILGIAAATAITAAAPELTLPALLMRLGSAQFATSVATQAAGAALPGKEAITPGERAARVGLETVGAAAVPLVFKGAGAAASAVKQGASKLGQKVVGATPDAIGEAAKLGERTGIEFGLGDATQSRAGQMANNYVGSQIESANVVQKATTRKLDQLERFVNGTASKLGASPNAARNAIAAHETAIKKAAEARAEQAAIDFAPLKSGAQFPLANTLASLERVKKEYSTRLGGDEATNLVKWLSEQRAKLIGQNAEQEVAKAVRMLEGSPLAARPDSPAYQNAILRILQKNDKAATLDANEFQNSLRIFGKASYDPRGLIDAVKNPDVSKNIAREVHKALLADLEQASAHGGDKIAQSLKVARSNYAEASRRIQALTDNPLAGVYKKPNQLLNKFLAENPDETELKQIVTFLEARAPKELNAVRGAILERAARSARVAGSENAISPDKLSSVLSRKNRGFDIAFAGNQEAKGALSDLRAAANLLRDRSGLGASRTQPLQNINLIMGSMAAATANPTAGAALVAKMFATRQLAKALTNPIDTRAYATVLRAAAKPELFSGAPAQRALKAAVARVVGQLIESEAGREPAAPEPAPRTQDVPTPTEGKGAPRSVPATNRSNRGKGGDI